MAEIERKNELYSDYMIEMDEGGEKSIREDYINNNEE